MTKAQDIEQELKNGNGGEGITVDMPRYVTVEGTLYMRGDLAHGLEGALQKVSDIGHNGMPQDYNAWLTSHDKIAEIADKALANAKGDNDE